MAEYKRLPQLLPKPGQTTRPRDKVAPGRQQLIENLRQYALGTLEVRAGLRQLTDPAPSASDIHSIARLNDPTPDATAPAIRVAGISDDLYSGAAADPQVLTQIDTGYADGEPMSMVAAHPIKSPRPYLYVANRSRQRKLSTTEIAYPIGLAPPSGPPSVVVSRPLTTTIQLGDTAGDWTPAGTVASVALGITRVNTTVDEIVYDSGNTGWACIVPTDPSGIVEWMLLTIDGETVPVHQMMVAVSDTTIAQIVYDSGSTGACSIQPVTSLGVGQLEDAPWKAYSARGWSFKQAFPKGARGVPPQTPLTQPRIPRIRQVDFPVGSLVRLSGTETVRIWSIAVGSDGIQSFRTVTANTHAATGTIAGRRGFRCHLNHTVAPGAPITMDAVRTTLTPPTGTSDTLTAAMTGGLKATPTVNGAIIGSTRPTLGDDIIHVHVRADYLSRVSSIRLYLDVDVATNDFLRNYFVYEWRASDLVKAIQSTNGESTQSILSGISDATVNDQYGASPESPDRPQI